MEFKVEKNVGITTRAKYPFKTMNVGDSFVCEERRRPGIYKCAIQQGMRIATRKQEDGTLRVWRIK